MSLRFLIPSKWQDKSILNEVFTNKLGFTCLRGFANNKGADQPGHLCSLISAFVIYFLENISKLARSKISIFQLVSVAEQAGLGMVLEETPKICFLVSRPKYCVFSPREKIRSLKDPNL